MADFAYNNAKNTNTDYTSFVFNYDYQLYIFFEDKTDSYLIFRLNQ